MEDFAAMIVSAVDFMKIDFTVYGFTLSYWDIFLYTLIAPFVIWLIVRFLYE